MYMCNVSVLNCCKVPDYAHVRAKRLTVTKLKQKEDYKTNITQEVLEMYTQMSLSLHLFLYILYLLKIKRKHHFVGRDQLMVVILHNCSHLPT